MQQVFAHSPQAKGLVEQAAGTFQDRLMSEMRLAGVNSLAAANEVIDDFLPRFNARFGIAPRQLPSAYRPLPPGLNLDDVLCYRYPRRVARDTTVQFAWRTLQLLPTHEDPRYAGAAVQIREHLNGVLTVWHARHPGRESGRAVEAYSATRGPLEHQWHCRRARRALLPRKPSIRLHHRGSGARVTREIVRYERSRAGELLHRVIKKLGRIPPGGGKRVLPQFRETHSGPQHGGWASISCTSWWTTTPAMPTSGRSRTSAG